ncbi:hypothetical protein [Mycolicibacterium arseniciresistens]|uniref:Secreted protein n=1 Tax=Mycolicibacterium arseniciresistens TaxID=3062257 RepID=A0ABT8UME7_9MYCO|nr:hypothetical protein [Mycolicibacterium arseniciresistens]MDO3638941.1 hypothetical protein [Mycolicibacterium arseniciresistens]
MTNAKSIVKNVAAGTLMGGGLLIAAGLGTANAQPLQNTPDGLVNVAVAEQTILEGVSTDEAATKTAAICGSEVAEVTALADRVDAEGTEQTVCAGLPGGDLVVTQNAAQPEGAESGAAETGPEGVETPDSAPVQTG